ncbi:ninein isoform X1 [Syngnathus acus]|uniref:ninein isoform X1 n=2 Tax=Syngnathus acus TaxID=161584 RepID=UPI001885F201|nr:ninein isoform X1 [Syngnathus acus]
MESLLQMSVHKGRLLSRGMDDVLEQDQYEERLKEVFDGFDGSRCGSLCPEELADLCLSLHLEDVAPALLDALLQGRDRITDRVDFEQFRDALILALSSGIEAPPTQQEVSSRPESPDIQPKFVKGSKRYGRRSKPDSLNTISDFCEDAHDQDEDDADGQDAKDNCDSAIPRKRERWNADQTSTEEYEAEGQMHLWNPDEPSPPRGCVSAALKEKIQEACEELAISWDGCAGRSDLLALCDHLGLEISADVLRGLNGDSWINVQEFVSMLLKHNKPATPSASTPYRQLKRQHSTQPFDEVGRRIANPSALMSAVATRLFSSLDDGTGFTPVESVIHAWMEDGVENSSEILQALNFNLDGKLSLCDLTVALENELLTTKNDIHQAALATFKAEIRHLLERVDSELSEKEKIRSDLEKAERLKTQLAAEVDEHHLSIERTNNLNLRKLEEEHQEKLAAVRSELMKEMDLIRQQAEQQCQELEAEVDNIKEDETFLREHLSISVKENRRLEMDLLDCSEKLMTAQSQVTKLQAGLDILRKEKFGDLDPSSADFLLQEERIKQLRLGYEEQCRELQDRVDELQSELRDFQSLGRPQQACSQPLSEELESKSPAVESDPGLGSEEVHPFISMSLEAEMMLEQQKEQHLRQMDDLRNQLESKINEFNAVVAQHEDQKTALALQHQQEVQAWREELAGVGSQEQELQSRLEVAQLERTRLEEETQEEASSFRWQLLEVESVAAEREEQVRNLQERNQDLLAEMEELRDQHASVVKENTEQLELRLKDREKKHQEEKDELEKRWMDCFEKEKELLRQSHQEELTARLDEARSGLEEEHVQTVKSLTEELQEQRARLDEQNNESLQALLEEAMLRLVKEQEEKESERTTQYEQREAKLKQEWERERLQLEEDYEDMLQESLDQERQKHQAEKEELEGLLDLKEEALREMAAKHAEERNALGTMLDKLRDDIAQERCELEQIKQEKVAAELLAENLNKEMSDLRSQSQRLQDENGMLADEKARSLADADQLKLQLAKLTKDDKQEVLTGTEKKELAACVRALEAELTKAVKDTVRLKNRNGELAQQVSHLEEKLMEADSMENHLSQLTEGRKDAAKETRCLRKQMAKFQERVKSMDDSLQSLSHQKACLRSDLRVMQQERDSLRQEVGVLHKQLQNAADKNHIMELALHEAGVQNPSRKLHRDNTLQPKEQDEKVSILSVKQQQHRHSQTMVLKALEKENASLKQELDAQKLLIKELAAKEGHAQLQEENEALKAEIARITEQFLKSFHVHFSGLLPTSPRRTTSVHCSDNAQDDQKPRMERMESRMKEIEASLRNVKLLLREKVAQLKEQVHKNSRADVLIRDLYVENGQLLKALEALERRRRTPEKTKRPAEDDTLELHTRVCGPNPPPLLSPSYNFNRV